MAIHIALLVLNEHYVTLPSMDVSVVLGLPTSLLIFLVVFYNDNCYKRYFDLWEDGVCVMSSIVCAAPSALFLLLKYSWQLFPSAFPPLSLLEIASS